MANNARDIYKFDKDDEYRYYQSAVNQQNAYDDRALRQDELNHNINSWANDFQLNQDKFDYTKERDTINDDWNAMKYNTEAQKLDLEERKLTQQQISDYQTAYQEALEYAKNNNYKADITDDGSIYIDGTLYVRGIY